MIGPGSRIDDRFLLEARLGAGAAAQVYRGLDESLDRRVAIKLLEARGPLSSPERFQEEARALASLQHPHVLAVLAYGHHEGRPYLVLELVEGGSLSRRLEQSPLGMDEARELARQTLAGLGAAHDRGILHRDLKPENVLLTSSGDAKLADFGLAKLESSGVRTASGIILGTPEYMAPEVMFGKPATPASDVYSWGCLLYATLNGRSPHVGTVTGMVKQKAAKKYPSGNEQGLLEEIIAACLEPEPEARPPVARLQQALAEGTLLVSSTAATRAVSRSSVEGAALPRGLATSAVGDPRGLRGPSSRLPLVLSGLVTGGLLVFLLMQFGGRSPPPPTPPAVPPSRVDEARREELTELRKVARRWLVRSGEFRAGEVIRELHARVFPSGMSAGIAQILNPYTKAMEDVRRGRVERAPLAYLDEQQNRLRYSIELKEDRQDLREFLAAEEVPFEEKADLYRALQPFAFVDTYFVAWDRPPPYRARSLQQVLVRRRILERDRAEAERPTQEPSAPLEDPGRYLLFEWETPAGRKYPWLFPEEGEVSDHEFASIETITGATDERWRLAEHHRIVREVDLAGAPARGREPVSVLLGVEYLMIPNQLEVRWNGLSVFHVTEVGWPVHWGMDHPSEPDHMVEVRLPAGALREGRNELVVEPHPLPGLPRWSGTAVHWVGLVVGER